MTAREKRATAKEARLMLVETVVEQPVVVVEQPVVTVVEVESYSDLDDEETLGHYYARKNEPLAPETQVVTKKKKKRQTNKRCKFKQINDRDPNFESLGEVDQYIRTNNQYNFRILNSNPVKCSVKCGNLEYHQMRRIYTDCMCNKDECDKRYSYICCENQTTWYLTTTGHHPFVQMAEDEKIKQYEIPIKIKELFDQICDSNPDLRPKQLMVHVETCRRTNER